MCSSDLFTLPTGWANTGGAGNPSAARTISIGDTSVTSATFTVRPTNLEIAGTLVRDLANAYRRLCERHG